jgi:uncharacterized protein (TIGR02284 family)
MDHDEVAWTLNVLLRTAIEEADGFEACAENVTNLKLKASLETAARRCREGAKELERKVRSLGSEPAKFASANSVLHRLWTDLKVSIIGMDDDVILAECERVEGVAQDQYEAALCQNLPSDVRTLVEEQYDVVIESHDLFHTLRNAAA